MVSPITLRFASVSAKVLRALGRPRSGGGLRQGMPALALDVERWFNADTIELRDLREKRVFLGVGVRRRARRAEFDCGLRTV